MEIITGNVTIKQIFADHFDEFRRNNPQKITRDIEENVEKMLSCRDPEKIGFAQYQCPEHPEHTVRVPHSCKSRFCNTCGKVQTDEWVSNCHQILPNVDYFHLTLTIPQELRGIFQEIWPLLGCLFTAANQLLRSFFIQEKKITPAITMVLHTFGRRIN